MKKSKRKKEREKNPFSQSPAHAPSDNLKGKKKTQSLLCVPARPVARLLLRSVDRYTLHSSTPQRYGSKNTRSNTSICTVNNYPRAAGGIKEKRKEEEKEEKKNSSRMMIMLKKLPWDIRKGIARFTHPANAHTNRRAKCTIGKHPKPS
jgi:hypothetical protein